VALPKSQIGPGGIVVPVLFETLQLFHGKIASPAVGLREVEAGIPLGEELV
jgi:hypothetical protein